MKYTKHLDGRDHHHCAEEHSAHNSNKSEHRHGGRHSHHNQDDDHNSAVHHERHGHHGHGNRHEHKGAKHRQRLFDYGELRLLVLSMIEGEPRHGYELIKEIETRFEGRYSPSPGVIYPTLSWLDDMGYVLQHIENTKKQYLITEEGKAFLTANREAADELLTRQPSSPNFRLNHEKTDQHNLRELMGSLRHLIKEKLSQHSFNDNLHKNMATIVQKAYDDIKNLK